MGTIEGLRNIAHVEQTHIWIESNDVTTLQDSPDF